MNVRRFVRQFLGAMTGTAAFAFMMVAVVLTIEGYPFEGYAVLIVGMLLTAIWAAVSP